MGDNTTANPINLTNCNLSFSKSLLFRLPTTTCHLSFSLLWEGPHNKTGNEVLSQYLNSEYCNFPQSFVYFKVLESLLTSIQDQKCFLFSVPGIAERLDQSLQLKPKYQDMAQKTLRHVINQHLEKVNGSKKKKQNKKKKPKKKPKTASDFIYVGIHARRGDHINYEVEKGITSLKSGYYLEAMEKYR